MYACMCSKPALTLHNKQNQKNNLAYAQAMELLEAPIQSPYFSGITFFQCLSGRHLVPVHDEVPTTCVGSQPGVEKLFERDRRFQEVEQNCQGMEIPYFFRSTIVHDQTHLLEWRTKGCVCQADIAWPFDTSSRMEGSSRTASRTLASAT